MAGRMNWDRSNKQVRMRKYGSEYAFHDAPPPVGSPADVSGKRAASEGTPVKRAGPPPEPPPRRVSKFDGQRLRLLASLESSLSSIGADKWNTKGATYHTVVTQGIKTTLQRLTSIAPDAAQEPVVKRAQDVLAGLRIGLLPAPPPTTPPAAAPAHKAAPARKAAPEALVPCQHCKVKVLASQLDAHVHAAHAVPRARR